MNAPLQVPLDENVIQLFDLVGQPSSSGSPEPRAREPKRPEPLTPARLLRAATLGGFVCALLVALVLLGGLFASGQPITQQQGWMVATYAFLAFSFGITAGSVAAVARDRVVSLLGQS